MARTPGHGVVGIGRRRGTRGQWHGRYLALFASLYAFFLTSTSHSSSSPSPHNIPTSLLSNQPLPPSLHLSLSLSLIFSFFLANWFPLLLLLFFSLQGTVSFCHIISYCQCCLFGSSFVLVLVI